MSKLWTRHSVKSWEDSKELGRHGFRSQEFRVWGGSEAVARDSLGRLWLVGEGVGRALGAQGDLWFCSLRHQGRLPRRRAVEASFHKFFIKSLQIR